MRMNGKRHVNCLCSLVGLENGIQLAHCMLRIQWERNQL